MSLCFDSLLRGMVKSGEAIWGAPTFDQCRTAVDETCRAVGSSKGFAASRMMYTLPNGGRILYRSLDNPDSARSKTAGLAVIDEAPFVDPRAWHEVIRPMLIDTDGGAWLIGTPKGRNYYYAEWQGAQGRDDWATFHAPTLGVDIVGGRLVRKPHPLENPFIEFSEIENLYQTMPERVFRQEILAEFVDNGGGVFRRVREAATAVPQQHAEAGHAYVFGVDWARTNDYTVISGFDVAQNALVAIDRFNQTDYATQTARLIALHERFKPTLIVSEGNSMGGPLTEDLQARGLPVVYFNTTAQTKGAIIQALELAFERQSIRILENETLIAELEAYEMERTMYGMKYGAPQGMHDDCVMSLALAWFGAGRQGSIFA